MGSPRSGGQSFQLSRREKPLGTRSAYHLHGKTGYSGVNSNGTGHSGELFFGKKVIPSEVSCTSLTGLSLRARLVGEKAPEVTIISTPGKTNKANKYSFVFSIIAEAEEGQRFKLLIQEGVSESEYARINDAFLTFLKQYHSGNLDKKMVEKLVSVNVVGGTLLLAFNDDIGELEPIDPRPKNINSNE